MPHSHSYVPRRRRRCSWSLLMGDGAYPRYLLNREMGLLSTRATGFSTDVNAVVQQNYKNLLKSSPVEETLQFPNIFDPKKDGTHPPGGIYNLEFNTEGSLLAAATENTSVLLFDPNSRKLVNTIVNAHDGCVNCVRFLDSRSFATCSDDTTVALWDARYLKTKVRSLKGHANWVKNIEYSFKENLLVTSGFDGAIFTWDINKYSERGDDYSKILYLNALMRMRLTPSGDQMVISTMNGYILIIHDLSLKTLKKDLEGFKPNLYRLLQVSGRPIPDALNYTHLFHAARNRTEIISDFAPNNDAETIASLQVHPQGWVVVSRNISSDNRSEWCCVHDLHSYPTNPLEDEMISSSSSDQRSPSFSNEAPQPSNSENIFSRLSNFMSNSLSSPESLDHIIPIRFHRRRGAGVGGGGGGDGEEVEDNSNEETERRPSAELGFSSLRMSVQRMIEDFQNHTQRQNNESDNNQGSSRIFLISPDNNQIFLIGPSSLSSSSSSSSNTSMPKNPRIHRNINRLTHYIEESNTGRGLIKEVSFSSDGRIICSPFGFGIRLLGFDSKCSELNRCLSTEQRQLTELGTVTGRHDEVVLSTAFSPNQYLLVSGCLSGKISWYQPVL
ncbi:DDB1- and CUL4-associated factor 10 homolog [Lepeophtheirus salmonis]|uniref:Uncharacterized protein n=1 Tax=Lepeophtheirus salmonis TaxID=72036 RepID=A0A0K2VIF1_LEPSM|nr:DDB1- and CUL4-associated factor 10-like [Lepeophtheirus salmonis]